MKKILFTTVLLFCFLNSGQAQRFNYEKTSKLFFGLNIGRTWHTTDVENVTKRFPIGVGAVFGGSINQNYGNQFSFDIRVRYLGGNWFGQDSDTTNAILNNNAVNAIYDTLGYTVQNFKATQHRLSIELSMHANRLKERSGIDPYIFVGIGFTNTRTKGDLVNSNGDFYSYNQTSSGGIIDKDYNTPLDLNEDGEPYKKNEFDVKVLPSLGVGVGYYFNSRFSLGIEHKTTFFMDDYFDGTTVNQDGAQSKLFKNDLYHYTSIYFKWYLKGRTHTTTPVAPEDSPRPVTPHPGSTSPERQDKPIVHFTTPATSPHQSTSARYTVVANVLNVENSNDIRFLDKGSQSKSFKFHKNTNTFKATVILKPGKNVFYLNGKNKYGSDSDEVVIYHEQKKPKNPPMVNITIPNVSPYQVNRTNITVRANIKNIQSRNQITATLNGQSLNNFDFSTSGNNNFKADLQLKPGANTLVIKGQNNHGIDSDETTLIYKRKKPGNPPMVNITIPNVSPYQVNRTNITVRANIKNIQSRNQITATLNGQSLNNFDFTTSGNNNFKVDLQLKPGANTLIIKGQNNHGIDSDETTIIYKRKKPGNPPTVNITTPNRSPYTTHTSNQNVVAKVEHVDKKQQIEVRINNVKTNNFTFNKGTLRVQFNASLKPGANNIRINANNTYGNDYDETLIHFKRKIVVPPQVQFTAPANKNKVVSSSSFKMKAKVKNISNINGIKLYFNGSLVPNSKYSFNSQLNIIQYSSSLKQGNNTFKIKVQNNDGTDVAQTNIKYKKKINETLPDVERNPIDTPCDDPVIQSVTPKSTKVNVTKELYSVRAVLKNINTRNDIQITLNGKPQNKFLYYARTKNLSNEILLKEGKNIYVIKITNECSSVSERFEIFYEAPKCNVLFKIGSNGADFCLSSPQGTANGEYLKNNPNFNYNGPAKSLYFKAIANGIATVNGKDFALKKGTYYHFVGNITVDIGKNRSEARGKWSLCVNSTRAPISGKGNNKPDSPCATADSSTKKRPDVREKPDTQKKPDVRERPGERKEPSTKERPNRRGSPKKSNQRGKRNVRNPRGGR